jgi:hypothetical protein
MGEEVERVELGVPPFEYYWDEIGSVTPELIARFEAKDIVEYESVEHMLDTSNMVLGIDL